MAESMLTGGNTFYKISVAGQSDVVSDAPDDTLNIASAVSATAGIVLTTNASTDTVTVGLAAGGIYDMSRDAAFMAAYNAGTDCQTHLQDALTNCLSWGYGGIYLPYLSGKNIKFSGQLTVPPGVSVHRNRKVKLEYTGTADEAHVIVGTVDVYNGNVYIDIEVVRTTPAVWSSKPNDTGILLHSPNFSRLVLGADMFTNGVIIKSGAEPASWLSLDLCLIRDAQFGCTFHKTGNTNNSYINELKVKHSDGEFNISTDCFARNGYTAGTKYPVGFRFISDYSVNSFDNHSYDKPCFELNGGGHYTEIAPFQFEASANTIVARDIRLESGLAQLIRHKGGVLQSIDMHIGYTDATPAVYSTRVNLAGLYRSEAGQNYHSNVKIWGTQFTSSGGGLTWKSPNLGAVANQYDAAGRIYVPGFYWQNTSDNTRQKRSVGTSPAINTDAIEIVNTDNIGLLIHLNGCRRFRVRPIVKSGGSYLRQGFIPWNSTLTQRCAPAYLTAIVVGGAVTGFNYLQGGKYDTDPTITVPGGTGLVLGAITRDGNGAITNVAVTNGGTGFTNGQAANIVSNDEHWLIGPGFQEDEVGWYGCYYDNDANPLGYVLQVRDAVEYVEWRGRGAGGSVFLSGVEVESLDGNPVTCRSWFDGYSDFTKRKIAFNPNGTSIKGYYAQGEIIEYDGRSIIGEPAALSYRGGTSWDEIPTSNSLGTASALNISVGTSAPGSPSVGDLWVDTN